MAGEIKGASGHAGCCCASEGRLKESNERLGSSQNRCFPDEECAPAGYVSLCKTCFHLVTAIWSGSRFGWTVPLKIILEVLGARINTTTSLDQADGRVRNIFGHFPPVSGTTSFGLEFIELKRFELNGIAPRHNKKAKK